MKRPFFLIAIFSVILIAGGCTKKAVTEPEPVISGIPIHVIQDLPADTASLAQFTYFSLRDSSVVTGADTATTKWDLAFEATRILTNSGGSGPGMGGAIVLSGTDFDTLSSAPSTGYSYDTTSTQTAIRTGSDNGWYHYDFVNNIITPVAGRVLVIRTADGKYAKVQIVSYYQGSTTTPTPNDIPRFYTFKYVIQPDGSTTLR